VAPTTLSRRKRGGNEFVRPYNCTAAFTDYHVPTAAAGSDIVAIISVPQRGGSLFPIQV
jgi:hypothetical protein